MASLLDTREPLALSLQRLPRVLRYALRVQLQQDLSQLTPQSYATLAPLSLMRSLELLVALFALPVKLRPLLQPQRLRVPMSRKPPLRTLALFRFWPLC